MSLRELAIRILPIVDVLLLLVVVLNHPANAQEARGYMPHDGQPGAAARVYATPLPESWMRNGGASTTHPDPQKSGSRLQSLFHNGGAVSVPEGSSCEACH